MSRLRRMAGRAALRLRLNAVFARAALLSFVPILWAAVALVAVKVGVLAAGSRAVLVGTAVVGAAFVSGVLHVAFRRRAPFEGALALDRHHGLHERITNALAFEELPAGERTALVDAAVEDAVAVAKDLSPRKAVPLRAPRDLLPALGLALAVLGIGLLEVPVKRVVPPEAPKIEALTLTPDDLELFRRMSDETTLAAKDPEAVAGARRFNQLVEDIAERRLDRREVFRRLDELERALDIPAGADAAALDEALDGVARELDKSALSKPVAEALADKRLADAEQALRDLAKKVENAKKQTDKAKLEALRQALQKSSEVVQHQADRADAEQKQLEETRKRLLQKKQKEKLSPSEQSELDRTERRLERLNREKQQRDGQKEQLSGLDKDLAKAAQDLMKDLGLSGQDLQQGAEDLHRAANKKLTEEQKQEMKRRLEELRQILRQEGQAGKDRVKRMLQFGSRARDGQGQGRGQGQGKEGEQGGEGGQGKDGKGKEPRLTLGRGQPGGGSAMVMMPGGGTAPGQGGGGEESKGGGASGGGEEWGTGHDPNLAGDATRLKGHTEDVTAAGVDTGQGASASQVIYSAAERGFRGRGYQKVYTDYQGVAEQAIEHDQIPPGYRFYVRRYFQLIRPRD